MPIVNGRTGQSGLFIVIGQERRFHFYTLGESTFQCFGNASMEYSPGFLGEGTVGRVLDERMLKVVGRKRDLALLEHEPGRNEQVEGLPQLAIRHFNCGPYQLIGELTPDRGPGLGTVL